MKNFSILIATAFLAACVSARPQDQVSSPSEPPKEETAFTPYEQLPSTPVDYMTQQENELKHVLSGTSFRVARENNILAIILSGPETFSAGDDPLTPATKEALEKIASVLSRYDKTRIGIIGYADSGRFDEDRLLSEKRAQAVAAQLKRAAPIDAVRFWVEGSNPETESAPQPQESLSEKNHADIILIPTIPTFIR